jgi:transmembrane protein 222
MESAFHDRQRLTMPSRGGEHPNESTDAHTHTHTPNEHLAYCILWSPLPPITFVLPFVGHLGIADSNGVASDFQGPYYVGDAGAMAFGPPTRALVVRGFEDDPDHWDGAIREANRVYRGRMHNICCDNCHSHVAFALNRAGAKAHGVERWDMVKLAALLFFKGRFLSWGAVLYQFGPFVTIILIVVLTMRLK